jgi:DNA-binding IclR family transcriptional regulator
MSPERLERALKQQNFMRYTTTTHPDADALIAEFDAIRHDGVAYDREEHEDGIISIAAPIFTDSGKVIGAVSIASATNRNSIEALSAHRERLIETTTQIGAAASAWQFPS